MTSVFSSHLISSHTVRQHFSETGLFSPVFAAVCEETKNTFSAKLALSWTFLRQKRLKKGPWGPGGRLNVLLRVLPLIRNKHGTLTLSVEVTALKQLLTSCNLSLLQLRTLPTASLPIYGISSSGNLFGILFNGLFSLNIWWHRSWLPEMKI